MEIELQHSGTIKVVPVVGIERGEKPALIVRWGFGNYNLDLITNKLVYIQGNCVSRKYLWKAKDIEKAWEIFRNLKEKP